MCSNGVCILDTRVDIFPSRFERKSHSKMFTSLVTIDRTATCLQLCHAAIQLRKSQASLDHATRSLFYAAYSDVVDDAMEGDVIVPVHAVRYGTSVKAPQRLIADVHRTIADLVGRWTNDPSIQRIVLCGVHRHAIVACCAAVCVQRIMACSHLHEPPRHDVHCITFGLPLYYANPTYGLEHTQIVMHDDWYVLTPFTIVIASIPGLCWIGTDDVVGYVCNKIESLFRTVPSRRTIRDYINAFMLEYEELLMTHRSEIAAPPPSPHDTVVVDV